MPVVPEEYTARMTAMLSAAAGRSGSMLVLQGPPAAGKTELLAHARELAGAWDFRVLSALGVQAEGSVPYAGLSELLVPVLEHRPRIPLAHSAMLSAALGLEPATAADRLGLAAATLSLLGTAAEDGALLVAVDDAQWLDEDSLEVLLFAGRRIGRERVAFLLAARPRPNRGLTERGLEVLRLRRNPRPIRAPEPEPAAAPPAPPLPGLTARERRVAELVADGWTNPEVASELFVSRKTVEFHLTRIYSKLSVRSRTELARTFAQRR